MPKLWNETIDAHRRAVHDAILNTAARLAFEHGLTSVTMSQIAAEVGIGRATLYKYFPDVCVRNGRGGVGQALEEETGAVVRLLEKSCWDRKLSFPSLAHFLTPSHCSRTRRGTQVKVESHGSGKKPHEPSR